MSSQEEIFIYCLNQQPNGQFLTDKELIENLNLNIMWVRYGFIHSSYTLVLIGAYIGISYDNSYLGGTPQDINNTSQNSICKLIIRFILGLLFFYLPIYLPKKLMIKYNTYNSSNDYIWVSIF